MKIYCPSHKRPDAPLFSIAKNLIIVLQHKEEIEEYKRLNEPRGHQIVCIDIDGNQRILEARNWIIQQDDDWSLQIDDDITGFNVWNKDSQCYEQIDWERFIDEGEKIVTEIDLNKTGMIRFGGKHIVPNENKKFEIMKEGFLWFPSAIINNKLLKLKNFKYEGHYLFDNSLGKFKTYGDDYFIQYWCQDNNFNVVLFNHLAIELTNCEWENSTLYNEDYSMDDVMSQTFKWLLKKFKYNNALTSEIIKKYIYHVKGTKSFLSHKSISHE